MKSLTRRIENYWDERSENFSRTRRLELEGVDAVAWKNLFQKNLPAGRLKILDVGTGAGFFAAILSELGHEVIGVDLSVKMLCEADKNLRGMKLNAEFKRMNAQELNFDDETFDAVVTRNLTWTLPNVKAAYSEWFRVLKVGGVLMNFDSDYGDTDFFDDKTCTKGEVPDALLIECDAIRNVMEISTRRRPSWDVGFLEGLNFSSVRIDEDISAAVKNDLRGVYDSVPLFAIYAVK